jgi:hypothetical protein
MNPPGVSVAEPLGYAEFYADVEAVEEKCENFANNNKKCAKFEFVYTTNLQKFWQITLFSNNFN